jgi:hypothetical protein
VTQANDESNKFSSQVVKEFGLFQKTKIMELKQGLLAYADCHIAFHEKVKKKKKKKKNYAFIFIFNNLKIRECLFGKKYCLF